MGSKKNLVSRPEEKQRLISSCKMVIKETNDLKSLDTKYILNVKTLKHMYIAKFLLSGLAVAGMLFTCKLASRIIRNKIDTFAEVKKKEDKKEKYQSETNSNDFDKLSSNENPKQFLEKASNMKSLNMDQGVDMNTCSRMLEKTNTIRDDKCYAGTVEKSIYSKNVQRNEPEEKERGTSKSIKELILLIEEALTTYDK